MKNTVVLILAAGEGTRFKSEIPKVLHKILGKTLIDRVLEKVRNKFKKIVVVIGHKAGTVKKAINDKDIIFIEQKKQLGSGHAVRCAEKILKNFDGNVFILYGDVPLLKSETIRGLLYAHKKAKAACTVLTCELKDPYGYGRIIRSGRIVQSIVEEKDAASEIKKIKEINSGLYVFSSKKLFRALRQVKPDNAKKEYYLTDVISILRSRNENVYAYKIDNDSEIAGINNRYELAEAEGFLRKDILKELMYSGITIIDPATTYIDDSVVVEKDTIIMPLTIIKGRTKIKSKSVIGPFSYIEDCSIGKDVEIRASFVYGAEIGDGVKIGPFSHIRRETKISSKAKIGNFSEIKKSYIGKNTKVSHLSYIGDSYLGKNINVGAGTITCNYDGKLKHKTEIGDDTFIGSNTNLIAPIKIGKGVLIAAGSTVTDDIPAKTLAIARARQIVKGRKTGNEKKR
ncbi:MAG: bifunctional UDP-N-acetylglucosamine diphosphorylase/glucosamine-1-phosphate N-acetyltransferase GlmU [Elusimicrobia bacterium]|nr:bifunctional UDP-N-acetylglucosamine diphosphorylase/glucosamine-1-phosphate N-acetyltransferase GlmU [Elusimicrobiota bacterium]